MHSSLFVLVSCLQLVSHLEPPSPRLREHAQEKQNLSRHESAYSATEYRVANQPTPTIQEPDATPTDRPHNEERAKSEGNPSDNYWDGANFWVGFVSAFFMIAFTACLVWVGIQQVWWMTKQAEYMRVQNEIMRIAERPRLAINQPDLNPLKAGEPIAGTFIIENKGRSPAYLIGLMYTFAIIKAGDDVSPIFTQFFTEHGYGEPKEHTIGGNGDTINGTYTTAKNTLAVESQATITAGLDELYFIVLLKYLDVSTNIEHFTDACFRYSTARNIWVGHHKLNRMT